MLNEQNLNITDIVLFPDYTVCPRSSDPFYIINYYTECVTTSWTYSRWMKTERTNEACIANIVFKCLKEHVWAQV